MSGTIRNKRIGVFDSGFGGLDILRTIVRKLPQYDYVYLGDTARAPYGHRTQETIHEYTRQAIEFLFQHDCSLIIVACNTSSSEALRKIQNEYVRDNSEPIRILGVLIPAAEDAIEKTKNRKVGILATEATVSSNAFIRELKKLDNDVQIFQQACPLLVPIIESGDQDSKEMQTILEKYLAPVLKHNIDTLVLGCTHYGILKKHIRAIIGEGITIISSSQVVPRKLAAYLEKHFEIEQTLNKKSRLTIFSTGHTDTFQKLGGRFFGQSIQVQKAVIG